MSRWKGGKHGRTDSLREGGAGSVPRDAGAGALFARLRAGRGAVALDQAAASQINGCAYCLDMHWKDLQAIGEKEQRMYSLDAWRECPYYTERERAALAWTEAVTLVTNGHVPDAVYEDAKTHFSEKDLADLTLAVATINAWNRLAIAARTTPGTYQPTKKREMKKGA